jgi:hypothetical protein
LSSSEDILPGGKIGAAKETLLDLNTEHKTICIPLAVKLLKGRCHVFLVTLVHIFGFLVPFP